MRKMSAKNLAMNNKGFSLTEIMIVLVIIGTIMGIVVPKVMEGRDNSNVKNTRIRMNEVDAKVMEYQAECGKLPTTIDFLITDSPDCRNWTSNSQNKKLMKDEWQTDLSYEAKGNGYILKSYGKDKKDGGTGPDKDIYSEGSATEE